MTLSLLRCFFIVISSITGYYIGNILSEPLFGGQIGCLVALMIIILEQKSKGGVSLRGLTSMVFGLILGVFMAKLLSDIFSLVPVSEFFHSTTRIILTIIFSYLGAAMALRGKDEFNIIIPYVRFKRQNAKEGIILLDTSAIIDGRISTIYKSNFLMGRLVVPRFVLNELQKLSDSADDKKREKGRRGLELLRQMQNDSEIDIHIHEEDIDSTQEVDLKLIHLAKLLDGKLCTTDFNLSRTAMLQKVQVLNINELANAVRNVFYSGDHMTIRLMKEGKEAGQAIGYLEDGTMIVVSNAREMIGQEVKVVISSVLQTNSGKMIFASLLK